MYDGRPQRQVNLRVVRGGRRYQSGNAGRTPDQATDESPDMLPQPLRKIGRYLRRLAFHRKIDEEDGEDESGAEHADGEERAGGIGPQPLFALPRLIQQRSERAQQQAAGY